MVGEHLLLAWMVVGACVLLPAVHCQNYLATQSTEFHLNGQKVYLSGMSIGWQDFARDFGEGQYDASSGLQLENYLRDIASAGGNSVRIWVHGDGQMTPIFDAGGYVSSPDNAGTFINDLARYLDEAYNNNILVTLVLWNGRSALSPELRGLITDENKLQSYIDYALVPMVNALKEKVALAAWEIVSEPEGGILVGEMNVDPCFDTTPLSGSDAGWTGEGIPMMQWLRFINRQIAAIKGEDTKALATVGAWSELSCSDILGATAYNYYKDSCLEAAGGMVSGTLDFYQVHTYAASGSYSANSPLMVPFSTYGLDKPMVIGEFSQAGGDGRDITLYQDHGYTTGYAGTWTWKANGDETLADDFATQARATEHLRGHTTPGGYVDIELN